MTGLMSSAHYALHHHQPRHRHGLAESSAKDGCLGVGSRIRVTFGHRGQPTLHFPVAGFHQPAS